MKINFIFSNIYESVLAKKPVSIRVGTVKTEAISQIWQKERKKIEGALFKVTGLRFGAEKIICYVNSRASFSSPLSLKISPDVSTMRDNLIHELIHVLLTQNIRAISSRINNFHKMFSEYVFTTRIHILIHAIHLEMAKELYPERVRSIRAYSKSKEYRISWDVVDDVGPKNIVRLALGRKIKRPEGLPPAMIK